MVLFVASERQHNRTPAWCVCVARINIRTHANHAESHNFCSSHKVPSVSGPCISTHDILQSEHIHTHTIWWCASYALRTLNVYEGFVWNEASISNVPCSITKAQCDMKFLANNTYCFHTRPHVASRVRHKLLPSFAHTSYEYVFVCMYVAFHKQNACLCYHVHSCCMYSLAMYAS